MLAIEPFVTVLPGSVIALRAGSDLLKTLGSNFQRASRDRDAEGLHLESNR
jgi:hypothetical protein